MGSFNSHRQNSGQFHKGGRGGVNEARLLPRRIELTLLRYQDDKPAYFKFLTILAFNVFIKQKVDVAVIEVGIGGTIFISIKCSLCLV